MLISRWFYYLRSIPTLLVGIKEWPRVIAVFLGLPVQSPFVISLRNGLRFIVRSAMDIWVIKEICLDRDYDHASGGLEDGWRIIDVGAGLGDFAVSTARRYPKSMVYAYEPSRESFALLNQNLLLNQINNVHAAQCAVSGQATQLRLEVSSGVPVLYSTIHTYSAGAENAQQVPCITLEQALDTAGWATCDFLKMDCEGAEFDILFNAAPATLARITRICLEYHNNATEYTHNDLRVFLERHGFQVRTVDNSAHRAIGLLYAEQAGKQAA